MLGVQRFALNSTIVDRNLGFGVTLSSNATVLTVHGTYFGNITTFNSTILPALLAQVPVPLAVNDTNNTSIQQVDWITSLTLLGGASTLEVPLHGYAARDNFFAKSVTTTEPFTEQVLASFFAYVLSYGVGNNAPVDWFSIINLYGGPDSQIAVRNESFAAYAGYGDMWVVQNCELTSDCGSRLMVCVFLITLLTLRYDTDGDVSVQGTFPESGLTFMNGLNDAMTDKMEEYAAYLNYVDPSYTRAEAYLLYYGEKLLDRLRTLKRVLDPRDIFSNPQSI